ncbi:TonB-dependent receptor plug domain-containing protein [Thiorhodococcus minor]|uniref:TonB-dependent receptor n=1 Tax=Thiorhodococcus minor TaxID=57489 RepID=A0A6M0K279_9GAMM|nr:TonB-dependent receptor [Thiorhodococcus minor]NEV62435.1 TonB-dependent receptor [Thiorhodococcus minor]
MTVSCSLKARRRSVFLPILPGLVLALSVSWAALANDLTDLSLEELASLEVTSVGKKAQPLSEAAAAIFVLSESDIRRSGATSIPEALRMVPGISVKRLDANKWSIGARGFGGRFSNKLLVLIDGRTVYTPSFSGVYWEYQDVMLADLDRIEVIRGPGATLWGANAVNGVINIITKSAAETQGGLLIAGVGSEERALVSLRYGGEIAPKTSGRVYAKYNDRDDLVTIDGDDGKDAWDLGQGGFRVDSTLASGDRMTLQGDVYRSNLRQQVEVADPFSPASLVRAVDDHVDAEGWNLLGRWQRALSVTSDMTLRLYYDHSERTEYYVRQRHDTLDLDFQQRTQLAARQDVVWGLGYRRIEDKIGATDVIEMQPTRDSRNLWSGFIQDEIALIPDQLGLTLGSKFEHNAYTGWEIQPNLRLLWKASERTTAWGAVSHAVRSPSRGETSAKVWGRATSTGAAAPYPQVLLYQTAGNSAFESETMTAYELGLRTAASSRLSLDLALFYNDYDDLRANLIDPSAIEATADGYLLLDLPFVNAGNGQSYGLELAAELQALSWWRLALAYSYLELTLDAGIAKVDDGLATGSVSDPRQTLSLRSLMNPRADIDLDLWLRYVDQSYPVLNTGPYALERIPGYWELDLRLAWRPQPHVELALVGQNLLHASHQEGYADAFGALPLEVERGVYASLRIAF